MARVTISGDVRGYSVGDDGRIWLSIDESEPSPLARERVHDLIRDFNPSSGKHGFGSRDVACAVKPGFASYRVTLTKEEAQGITLGSVVELTVDFFYVRRVVFVRGNNGKQGRWAAIPEMLHEVAGVRAVSSHRSPETPAVPSGNKSGNK